MDQELLRHLLDLLELAVTPGEDWEGLGDTLFCLGSRAVGWGSPCMFSLHRTARFSIRRTSSSKCGLSSTSLGGGGALGCGRGGARDPMEPGWAGAEEDCGTQVQVGLRHAV